MDMKNWRKSSYSSGNGGNCVEAAGDGPVIAIRDTKDKGHGPVLRFSTTAWAAFTASLKKLFPASQRGRASLPWAGPSGFGVPRLVLAGCAGFGGGSRGAAAPRLWIAPGAFVRV